MLRRGRGRPRKQVSCGVATLTSSHMVQLRRIGKVLHRKQLNLRRQRILELATASFCSKITGHRSSLRDLKHFARQLGKRAVPPVYPFCQQRANGALEERKLSPQREHDHVGWNSSESGDIATGTAIFEDILGSKEDESPIDARVDQWVGVEVLLFGRKSSIGEVGSTTSNVCDKLRSVVADPEREDLYASFAKRRDEQVDREWCSAGKDGIVPSWVSCRRSITRINPSGGISDCHVAALLASLPKAGSHIDGQAMTTSNISSTEETGLYPCADEGAVIPVDQSSATIITVDRSSAAVIPMEQSFASQESIVNSGKGSSLDIGPEKQVNISVLQRDAIQVCPTTPEKAQKRRRSYQDTIPNPDDRGMDACELSNGRLPIGNMDLRLTADDNCYKESGGRLLLTDSLSPYSVDFESSCNSTGIGERGLNVAVVECARSLVDSIPIPTIADPVGSISHVASVIVDPVQESSQLFQSLVPTCSILVIESNKRKEKRSKTKLNKDSSDVAIIPKVRKKYKPRVAKVKKTDKCCASRLQNETVLVMETGDKSVKEAGGKSVKEAGGRVLLMDTSSPYSVDFQSICNSTGVGEQGPNVAVADCARSLAGSTPTPAIADPFGSVSRMASTMVDPVQESSQLFQTHVPTGPVSVMESNKRKQKRVKSKLNKDCGGVAIIKKVRKKYKPRVAKLKKTDKCCASLLQNEADGNTGNHGFSKHTRTEVRHDIMRGGVHSSTSARNSCIPHKTLEYIGTIEADENLFYQEEMMGSKIGELASEPVTSLSPVETPSLSLRETPSSIDNSCLSRGVLEGHMPRLHPHGPFNLGHNGIVSDSLLCSTCGLQRRMSSDGSETGQIIQTNSLSSPSGDQVISNSCLETDKHFEALSVALSKRVLALLDLPSGEQPHSLCTIAGEVERSSSDVSLCNEEAEMKEYPQATDEDGLSTFSEEWTAYHAGSAEMNALDAFNEEEMRFDMFYKEQQSAVSDDTLVQTLNAELNEYFSAIADTWVRGSPCVEDHHGVSSNSQYWLDDLGDGILVQPKPCPSPVQRSLMAHIVSPESLEDRTMSSFYASTSAEVNDVMLSRLNKIIEENAHKDVLGVENAEQDLNMDMRPDCGQTEAPITCSFQKSAEGCEEVGLLVDYCREDDLMKMCDTVFCQMRSQFQNPGPDSTFSTESDVVPAEDNSEEDLMKMRDTVLCQMRSHFQNPDPDSTAATESDVVPTEDNPEEGDFMKMGDSVICQMRSHFQNPDPDSTFATESDVVPAEDNPEEGDLMKTGDTVLRQMRSQFQNPGPETLFATESAVVPAKDNSEITRSSVPCQLSFQSQDADPDSNFARESAIVRVEVNNGLKGYSHDILSADNAIPNETWPQKNTCPAKTPFHLMTFVQLVAYIKSILINTSEMSPLELLCHIQDHLAEDVRVEFEKLWPMILHPINCEELQKSIDLVEMDLPSCMELIQCQQLEGQEVGAKGDSRFVPCMEVFQCQQVNGQDDRVKEDNHLASCTEVIQNQQLERRDDGAKEDNHLAPCTEVIQYQQLERRDDGAKEDNHLAPCTEVIQYQQLERRDDGAKEVNHGTDIVPFVGNALVAYDGSSLLRKRKPRPKVNLDTETMRVWKLLMGKTETMENDSDVDNELKWKQERLIMQEQAESFIRRMHLIQGDRSFSRWKGSVVDSVIGVFLTQNVSDVLSSSAYMCLRARFPPVRGSVQSKSPEGDAEEVVQNDVQVNSGSFQTFQEPQTSCFHEASSNCASAVLENEGRGEILYSQECCHEESNSSNLETRQVGTLPFLGSESHTSLTWQQEESAFYTQPKQPPATDTSMNVLAGASKLNVHGITNDNENTNASDLGIRQDDIQFLSGYEDQGPLTSSIGQGENNFELNDYCIPHAECNLTKEAVVSTKESQLALSTSIQMQKEVLTGLERARLEAEQVRARKSSKWNAVAEKYNAKCQQAAMDAPASPISEMTEDGVNWEAVRRADVEVIADAIKERGMNWKLAGRIKGFLERLRLEQGSINLEWLRSIPSEDAKEFLTSVHGLGLKSVECIRLLSLHHLAFPVDTNVGRICVRLGWVPLEPLPEEVQLHVLELYPVQATIQKYLWPRLCTLDQQTLYELHYQLITFGKVFCTKSKPNCNACPMRSDCKHFASALASAKLALLPPEGSSGNGAPLALPPSSVSAEAGEGALLSPKPAQPSMCISQYCEPIIEEPMTPESEADMSEFDIEDYPFSVEEIAHETMMDLFIQEIQGRQEMQQLDNNSNCCKFNLSTTLSEPEIVQEMDTADVETLAPAPPKVVSSTLDSIQMIVDSEELGNDCIPTRATTSINDAPSREVIVLPPEAASIPVPKLKNIERLRTVHYVYELPDNHPLLEGMDAREADDPCFYLLAIWSPGEVPESIPNINDENEETGFNFSSDEESIKATLLVPCRTAMQGSFPLNGTYFQVNEVFADHASSLQPILVPRVLLWNLRRRFVYFGTSVTSILRGMTTEEIQACFWRGYVCVRGFDRMTRAPKPLVRRLHFQTTKPIMKSASVNVPKTKDFVKV